MTVKGHFERYAGTVDLRSRPAVTLTIDADSVQTKTGHLHAAGKSVPPALDAQISTAGDQPRIEATTTVDHRDLDMTWSPLGIMRAPSTLIVRGRLIRA